MPPKRLNNAKQETHQARSKRTRRRSKSRSRNSSRNRMANQKLKTKFINVSPDVTMPDEATKSPGEIDAQIHDNSTSMADASGSTGVVRRLPSPTKHSTDDATEAAVNETNNEVKFNDSKHKTGNSEAQDAQPLRKRTLVAWPLFTIVILLAACWVFRSDLIKFTRSQLQQDSVKNDAMSYLDEFAKTEPSSLRTYLVAETNATVINRSQRGPGKLAILYNQEDSTQCSALYELLGDAHQLFQNITSDYSNSVSHPADSKCLIDFNSHSDKDAANLLKDSYYNTYEAGARLMVLCRVDVIGAHAAIVLHGLADDQNPPNNDVLFIVTVAIDKSNWSTIHSNANWKEKRKSAERVLNTMLKRRVGLDEGPALLSRIGNAVLFEPPSR